MVIGAAGGQGGGLVRAVLADPEGRFPARAVTRRPDADKARALAFLGAEGVAVDADDPASLERVCAAAEDIGRGGHAGRIPPARPPRRKPLDAAVMNE